jgi:hypothetical protein
MAGLGTLRKREREFEKERKNIPKYTTPDEYYQALDIYKEASQARELPGQGDLEDKFSRITSEGIAQAQKFAPSSVVGSSAAVDLYSKKMDAFRDLGFQFALHHERAKQAYAQYISTVGMSEAQKRFDINKWYPSQVKLNLAAGRLGQAQGLVQSGLEGVETWGNQMSGMVYSMMGMQGMYPQFGGGAGASTNTGLAAGGYSAPTLGVGSNRLGASGTMYNPATGQWF